MNEKTRSNAVIINICQMAIRHIHASRVKRLILNICVCLLFNRHLSAYCISILTVIGCLPLIHIFFYVPNLHPHTLCLRICVDGFDKIKHF